jgi:hypothetical protein
MRQCAARWASLAALDQSGIEFPLLPEELAELEPFARPTSSSLAGVISSWRLSIAAVWPGPGDALDQWGIEFPIAEGEFAALARLRRGGCLQARSLVVGGRLRAVAQGGTAAILAVVVASSALAVNPAAYADAPVGTAPPVGTPAAQIEAQPVAPMPGATYSGAAIAIEPASSIPATIAPPAVIEIVPTIDDARSYLVDRLGTKKDKRWGMSQSQCASLIFEAEDQWNPHATNKSSGAYGLPQAHPSSKLASWAEFKASAAEAAGDPQTAWLYRAWRDNPVVQAEWGVDYMTDRYGSPCGALDFRNENGWY